LFAVVVHDTVEFRFYFLLQVVVKVVISIVNVCHQGNFTRVDCSFEGFFMGVGQVDVLVVGLIDHPPTHGNRLFLD
jgi:hypothetical protein